MTCSSSRLPFKLVGIGELTAEEMPEAKLLIFFIVYMCVDGEREIKELKKRASHVF